MKKRIVSRGLGFEAHPTAARAVTQSGSLAITKLAAPREV